MRLDIAWLLFSVSWVTTVFMGGVALGTYSAAAHNVIYLLAYSVRETIENTLRDPMTVEHSFAGAGLVYGADEVDSGYLLLSAYFPAERAAGMKLVRLADGTVIKEWFPDAKEIRKRSTASTLSFESHFQPKSAILMNDGGLIFIDHEGPLVRINSCSEIDWLIDEHFHHSIARGVDGDIYVPLIVGALDVTGSLKVRDDAVAQVSPTGQVIQHISVAALLERSGYRGLVFGSGMYASDPTRFGSGRPETDPVHLNDIKVAHEASQSWRRGDWLLSLRNRSALVLYRPSTDQVVWIKHGPWMRQHDPNFLPGGDISVFGNDVIDAAEDEFVFYGEHNQFYTFDPKTGAFAIPFHDVFAGERIKTPTQGRARILKNGDLFIEETDSGRLLRVSKERVIWRYNNIHGKEAGRLNWSRYLDPARVQDVRLNGDCARSGT